ncbi:MAG: PAS domain S-box protein, partial [Actinobacteria bacterium]|nr:PAS domain S-box protein [Actinomycetota bacterium]
MGTGPRGSDQPRHLAGPPTQAGDAASSSPSSPSPSSEIHRLRQRLLRQRQELEFKSLLLDNATDSIVAHDLAGRLVYVNEAATARMGYPREELLGRHLPAVLGIPKEAFAAHVQLILEKGQAIFESEDRLADGSIQPVEVHGRVLDIGERVVI